MKQSSTPIALLVAAALLLASCNSALGNFGQDGTPPPAPQNLQATAGDASVRLSWMEVLGATGYTVYWKAGDTVTKLTNDGMKSTTDTIATVTGLVNGTAYMFIVTVTKAGQTSIASSPATAIPTAPGGGQDTVAPANPTIPSAAGGNGQVTLSWANPSDADFASVEITWTPADGPVSQPVTIAKPLTSAVITGLVNGTSYVFTLKARDTSGNKSAGTTVTGKPEAAGSLSVEMVNVAGGNFAQGRPVTLAGFAIGKYEVTMEQYDAYCVAVGKPLVSDSGWGRGRRPAMNLSWFDAVVYCNWLSVKEGLQPAYSGGGTSWTMDRTKNGYRLPTEAEWEFAARGGVQSLNSTYAGGNALGDLAWTQANSGAMSHEVGTKAPNELGIYDMSGNVWEWCWDWYAAYPAVAELNPLGPSTGTDKVGRGGAWSDPDAYNFLTTSRWYIFGSPPQGNYLGFRVARTLPDTAPPANPTALSAAAGDAQVALSWTNPTDADFYSIKITWTPGGGTPTQPVIVTKPGTSQVIAGLNNGTTYSFTIKSVDTNKNESSGATVAAQPFAPNLDAEMVVVPGGTFTQGRQVTLSNFAIGKYEVTFDLYDAFCAATGKALAVSGWGRGRMPAMSLSWYDALAFCNWLSARDGFQAAYSGSGTNWVLDRTKNGYRLPTEAEWEYAARGGSSTNGYAYSGSNDINAVAWYGGNSGNQTHAVGEKIANGLGLFDMSGNVREWIQDWWGSYPASAELDPLGPASGSIRVLRGGAWPFDASECAVANHAMGDYPSATLGFVGFRLARSLPDGTPPANPTALAAAAGDTQLTLSWTNPTDADFVLVEISWTPAGGMPSQPLIVANSGTSQAITGLTNGTPYTFTIKSVDASGDRSSGATVTGTSIGTGTVKLSFTLSNPSYHVITFASNDVSIARGSSLNLFDTNLIGQGVWAWYVDDVLVPGQTSYRYTWDTTGKQPGQYIIDASVTLGGITYSGSLRATVTY